MAVGSAFAATVDLKQIALADLVWVVYGQILHQPFVLDDKLGERLVTFQYRDAKPESLREALEEYLRSIGIGIRRKGGVNYDPCIFTRYCQ